jgi:hypothetical protein
MLPLTVQFFIAMIACAINERQQKALEYKTEEVLVLKGILKAVTGKERIDFTEDQRRRLAVAGKELTAKEREEADLEAVCAVALAFVCTHVTSSTWRSLGSSALFATRSSS